jgi:hypothetical protein
VATSQAIAAISLALKGLLERALPKDEFPDAAIELLQPGDYANGMAEGVSLLLYRVAINPTQRNLPPRNAPDGTRFRPPLPVDLHYLLSAWADDADRQQSLLGWAMRLLEDTPALPGNLINPFMPEKPVFRADESVELVCDPLPPEQWLALWATLTPKAGASMTYIVRMVQIDSDKRMPDAERVRQRTFEVVKGVDP